MRRSILAAVFLSVSLAGCVETSTTTSANRTVTIKNQTGSSITNFYGSNAGSNSWEEDILGTLVLPSGSSANINFDDGSGYCAFDFKVVFADGSTVFEEDVDVCRISSYTIQ